MIVDVKANIDQRTDEYIMEPYRKRPYSADMYSYDKSQEDIQLI